MDLHSFPRSKAVECLKSKFPKLLEKQELYISEAQNFFLSHEPSGLDRDYAIRLGCCHT